MDPNATWETILEAWIKGDMETAGEHAEDLQRWLDRGGFAPTNVEDQQEFSAIMADSLAHAPSYA